MPDVAPKSEIGPESENDSEAPGHTDLFSQNSRRDSFLESTLNAFLRPRVKIGSLSISAYNAFGVGGIALVASITIGLTLAKGLSLSVSLALLALALILSILNIVITTILTGRDSLVFLRYFLSIMAGSVILLRIIDQPVLPYLENLMLGIGAMQGIGRIGCLRVGCCYGKPSRFGIRYTNLHAKAGFPISLVGVKLLPIQLVESCWVLFSAGAGVILTLTYQVSGLGLATYLILFATGRFCFELLRGDKARTQLGPFSEAQWISLGIVTGTVIFARIGFLPFHAWYITIESALLVFVAYLLLTGFKSSTYRFSRPAFVQSFAKTLARLERGRSSNLAGTHAVHLRRVNDMQISDGKFMSNGHTIHHYTLSCSSKKMTDKDALQIAKLLQSWHTQKEKSKLITIDNITYHILRYLDNDS